ncbi:MAG: hypothetical protein Ct9H300mP19_14950 [Dehalococcoidia bacterium]|nr:MAG: hypothetical protein Ct9H300mP19_14950 [Dehalococcoidia bacterium]
MISLIFPPKEDRSLDMAYMSEMSEGWYALLNEESGIGWAVSYPVETFKYLWYWRNFGGGFGILGMEDATTPDWSLAQALETGGKKNKPKEWDCLEHSGWTNSISYYQSRSIYRKRYI